MLQKITHKPNQKNILYLVRGDEVKRYNWENIAGFCAVIRNTDHFHILPGVRTICFDLPERGLWGSNFKSWDELEKSLDYPVPLVAIQKIVRIEFLTTARQLDEAAFVSDKNSDETVKLLSPQRRRPRSSANGDGKSLRAH